MVGDLNVSLELSKSWGPNAITNPLEGFFLDKILMGRFIDVDPLKLKPSDENEYWGKPKIHFHI